MRKAGGDNAATRVSIVSNRRTQRDRAQALGNLRTVFANGFHQASNFKTMNMTKELSESLLAACKAAGIEKPRYIAQDKSGFVFYYNVKPNMLKREWLHDDNEDEFGVLNHPPYADDWQDSLLEWVDHVADTSKMIDDACEIAYHKHIENGNGFRWSRLDCYRAAWRDALAWKGGASE
jgi:hypothetical protein